MELREKVIRGTSWSMFSQISIQALSLGVTIVLARLLNPEDFGIVALSAVFVGVVALFGGLGMGSAVIQRQNINDDYLSTSFWVSMITGVGITLTLVVISPFAAKFFDKNILKYIIMVSSAGFLLGPFTAIHITILTKNLKFNKLAFINITDRVISGITSIIIALLGYGVWSLILGGLVAQVLLIPIIWHMVEWRPRLIFRKKCFKDLFSFSSNLLAFNGFNYFARNFDNFIIGKILGPQILGYYSVAYNLMLKPLSHISWSVGQVLFPSFSMIQMDKNRLCLAYLKVIRSISLITFPMMMGLIVVSSEFVFTFYGSRWEPVITPLRLLCIVGALQSIGTTVGVIFNSQGRSDLLLKTGIFASTVVVIAFLIGIKWGLIGLIIGYIVISIPLFFFNQYFANRLILLKMRMFLKALLPATVCSVGMTMILSMFKYLNNSVFHLNIYITLIISVVLGVISYSFILLILFRISEVEEVKSFLQEKIVSYGKQMLEKAQIL